MTTYEVVGKRVTRQEGPDKVSGNFQYSADVSLPGMIWGKVLRSPYPHAKIVKIDASKALAMPGVHAVITGQDTLGMTPLKRWSLARPWSTPARRLLRVHRARSSPKEIS